MSALATILGQPQHRSPLLRRLARLAPSSSDPTALERLLLNTAWLRGCRYYPLPDALADADAPLPGLADLPHEELSIALMHPNLPWSPQRLRIAAAFADAGDSSPTRLARLARMERAVIPLRHIAQAGQRFEPAHPFWPDLLSLLPATPPPPPGVLPHPTRFIALTGRVRPGAPPPAAQWIRPSSP